MSFKISQVGLTNDERLLTVLTNSETVTQTHVWIKPDSPISELTIGEIERMAKKICVKEFAAYKKK